MRRILLYSLLTLFLLSTCSERNEQPAYEEMIFNVDSNLLGKKVRINSAGIEFHFPKGFEQVDSQMFEQLRQSLLKLKGFKHSPLLATINSDQTAILLFLRIFPKDSSIKKLTFAHVEEILQPNDTSTTINIAKFTKDSIKILQYLVDTGNSIDFKLFFHDKDTNLYELDYLFLSRDEYAKNIKAIESSIGSLRIHK